MINLTKKLSASLKFIEIKKIQKKEPKMTHTRFSGLP